MTKVKICGITNLEDAMHAVECGADLLGFNFFKESPRYISPKVARMIVKQIPESVLTVGVFVNAGVNEIVRNLHETELRSLQLHGDESPDELLEVKQQTGLEVMKAIRVGPSFVATSVGDYAAEAILLDTYSKNARGGTGDCFDWKVAYEAQYSALGVIYLAGGLTADNVSQAIRAARPFGVDVASGVESSPRKKDPAKVAAFIEAVRNT